MSPTDRAILQVALALLERDDPDLWSQAVHTLQTMQDARVRQDFWRGLDALTNATKEKRSIMDQLLQLATQRRRAVTVIRESRAQLLEEVQRALAFEVLKGPADD